MRQPTSALVPVIAGFSVMLLLLLAVTAIGVTHIRQLSNQLTAIVSERNQKSEFAASMRGLHESRFQSMLLASSMEDAFARDEEIMRFSGMASEFIQIRDRFLNLPLDNSERVLWDDLRGEVKQVELLADQVIDLLQLHQLVQARQFINQVLAPHQEHMMQGWMKLLELQRHKNQQALEQAQAARDRAQKLAFALASTAMLVGSIIAIFVVRLSRRMEKDLFEEKERAQITLQAMGDAVLRIDEDGRVRYLNPIAEHLVGMAAHEANGQPIGEVLKLYEKESQIKITTRMSKDALSGTPCTLPHGIGLVSTQGMEYEIEGVCSPIHTPKGETIGAVLVLRDVTEARDMQRKLVWQANHDSLTSLVNRRAFEDKVSRTLSSKRVSEYPVSILFIDLDRFKYVNDTAGHAAGDDLLRQLGRLMYTRIREGDLLARIGGDEFGIMLISCPPENAENIAHLIKDSIANFNLIWNGEHYQVGASIGVVHVPPHWNSMDECLAAADAACYQAKQNGRNQVVVHQS